MIGAMMMTTHDLAPFFEVLRARRSVRAFRTRPVDKEQLEKILRAANSAPSAGNLQAYEIVVIRDQGLKEALITATYNHAFILQAPVLLLFCAHPARSIAKYGEQDGRQFSLQDATIACAYAELATAALGLSTVWIGALDVAKIVEVTGIDADWRPIGLLPIGYPDQDPPPTSRRRLDDLVHELSPRQ